MAEITLRVEVSPALLAALDALRIAAGNRLPSALFEEIGHALQGTTDLIRAVALDGDGLATPGAGNRGVLLEPTESLLKLAAAASAPIVLIPDDVFEAAIAAMPPNVVSLVQAPAPAWGRRLANGEDSSTTPPGSPRPNFLKALAQAGLQLLRAFPGFRGIAR